MCNTRVKNATFDGKTNLVTSFDYPIINSMLTIYRSR